jgi:hypothetical protein
MRIAFVTPVIFVLAMTGHLVGIEVASMQSPPTLTGTWGGERIRLDGGEKGVRIQIDCLLAQPDHAIVLDAAGTFTTSATFARIRGVALDGSEQRPAVRIAGRVDRDVLHLTITPDDVEEAGSFTLRRNGKARLPNCRLRS